MQTFACKPFASTKVREHEGKNRYENKEKTENKMADLNLIKSIITYNVNIKDIN